MGPSKAKATAMVRQLLGKAGVVTGRTPTGTLAVSSRRMIPIVATTVQEGVEGVAVWAPKATSMALGLAQQLPERGLWAGLALHGRWVPIRPIRLAPSHLQPSRPPLHQL